MGLLEGRWVVEKAGAKDGLVIIKPDGVVSFVGGLPENDLKIVQDGGGGGSQKKFTLRDQEGEELCSVKLEARRDGTQVLHLEGKDGYQEKWRSIASSEGAQKKEPSEEGGQQFGEVATAKVLGGSVPGAMAGACEVYYHFASKPFWGRTYPIALLLEHGGVAYQVKKTAAAPSGTGFAPPMAQLPASGACLAQTPSICVQLGRDCGLSPAGAADEAKALQLACDAADMFTEKDAERRRKWLRHVDAVLKASGSGYFAGKGLSYADFCVLFPLTHYGPSVFKDYPDLTAWFTRMKALPGVRRVDAANPVMPGLGSICGFCGCCAKSPSSMGAGPAMVEPKAAAGLCKVEGAKYTVYYHTASQKFLGRSCAPLMLLEHAKAEYECKSPDRAPAGWFAPPIVKSTSGACISQTPAIMRMLGIELGLAPEEPKQAAKAFQLALDAADLFSEASAKKPKPPQRIQKWYSYLEGTLQSAGSGYLLAGGLSYADFSMLMTLEASSPGVPLETPRLKEWLSTMLSQDGVVAVKKKGIPVAPPS